MRPPNLSAFLKLEVITWDFIIQAWRAGKFAICRTRIAAFNPPLPAYPPDVSTSLNEALAGINAARVAALATIPHAQHDSRYTGTMSMYQLHRSPHGN